MKADNLTGVARTCVCCVCGQSFTAKLERAKYCSMRCKNMAARSKLPQKRCCSCHSLFQPSSIKQKHCSISCGLRHTRPSRLVTCKDCGVSFTYFGRGRCYRCAQCRKINNTKRSWDHMVAKGRIRNPGVGSGGAQFGEQNHQWCGGTRLVYLANYRLRCFRHWKPVCVVCQQDYDIEVHHVDGDGKNHSSTNLIPLCHEHHWRVHHQRRQSAEQLIASLERIWPNCRFKIAEKTGNSSSGQSEVKA